jgi:uncharacterized protein YabE (DUF348 family)
MNPNQRRRFGLIAVLLVVITLAAVPFVIYDLSRMHVTVTTDGHSQHIQTRAKTVQAVLDEAHVQIEPEDVVSPDLSTPLDDGMVITVDKAAVITLNADGSAYLIRTQLTQPLDILAQQRITVGTFDVVQVDGLDFLPETLAQQTFSLAPESIQVRRSVTLHVVDGERRLVLHTTQADVGSALDSAGLDLYLADGVTPGFGAPVEDGLVVEIQRSYPVTVIADGQRIETRTRGTVVGDALAQIGVAPVGLDYTIPPMDAPLSPGMEIRVIRVNEETQVEHDPIPYKSMDLRLGMANAFVIMPGIEGQIERQLRVRSEDGVEVSRESLSERITRLSFPQIVLH